MSPRRTFEILVVDDNPGDVRLIHEAFRESSASVSLSVATDGDEAMMLLRRQGARVGAARPDLILLDLNLPRRTGAEVLAEIRADPSLRSIPDCVFTTSDSDVDIRDAYDRLASCCLTKPIETDEFFTMVKAIELFWLQIATLPPRDPG